MKVSNTIQVCVSKIVKKERFVKDILISITNLGGKVLLVGGAVRDILLGLSVADLDFEVYGLSLQQLENLLQQYGIVSLVGRFFGVLRLHGLDVDWSLPRKDSSGRHPTVAYDPNMSYLQAFARRDLTMNSMGIDMHTFELIDLFGGQQDIQDKILRSPDLNFFAQDPLRLLRIMQFVGRFDMTVDEKLSQLCLSMDVSQVSEERIEQEFRKLFLKSQHPSRGLQWLVSIKKFHELLPDVLVDQKLWTQIDAGAQQKYEADQEKLVVMWAVIASHLESMQSQKSILFQQIRRQEKESIIKFMKHITNQQQLIGQVADLVLYGRMIDSVVTDAQMKWLAVWLAPHGSLRLLCQYILLQKDKHVVELFLQRAEQLGICDRPIAPLLSGKDFLDVASGVQLGVLVHHAYTLQIDQGLVDRFVVKELVLQSNEYKNSIS